jgi:hypothetical protein
MALTRAIKPGSVTPSSLVTRICIKIPPVWFININEAEKALNLKGQERVVRRHKNCGHLSNKCAMIGIAIQPDKNLPTRLIVNSSIRGCRLGKIERRIVVNAKAPR